MELDGETVAVSAEVVREGGMVMANAWEARSSPLPSPRLREEEDGEAVVSDVPPSDLIHLPHLHEPAVVHALRTRYLADEIYTSTGPVLLAINPFKDVRGMYGPEGMRRYWEREERAAGGGGGMGGRRTSLPPHIYAVADGSFRSMVASLRESQSSSRRRGRGQGECCNQSILVSGDSGTGKTESAKHTMKYLAAMSRGSKRASKDKGAGAGAGNGGREEEGSGVEHQILSSNPILESFGNARTVRNDNSSRFGKYIELTFSPTGSLLGASVETYLLERIRLVRQHPGERNYHIFYELLEGLTDWERERYMLDDLGPVDFNMTSASGTYDRRDGVRDEDTYEDMRIAMEDMNFTDDEVDSILSVTCAILHSSNVDVIEIDEDESALRRDGDNPFRPPHLDAMTSLLGLTIDDLETALCHSWVRIGRTGGGMVTNLCRSRAEKAMEALVKATYDALFAYVVGRINDSIDVGGGGGGGGDGGRARRRRRREDDHDEPPLCGGATAAIGILDIFGFESFPHNSLEQLCINYCNEALQRQFNDYVMRHEQEEYEREGIKWSFVSFPENQEVLDLIESKSSGILSILSDQCRAPTLSDRAFATNLYKRCSANSRFFADARQRSRLLFAVRHYAGVVEYAAKGFVEKNRDELREDLVELLRGSEVGFVRTLADIAAGGGSGGGPTNGRGAYGAGQKPTVGSKFRTQLCSLRVKIQSTAPHYVRCLKPNDALVPDRFDASLVLHQLRCAGVIEAVRVSRLGYPHRYPHKAFTRRYWILDDEGEVDGDGTVMSTSTSRQERRRIPAEELVWRIEGRIPNFSDLVQVGKTKVFLRTDGFELLEQLRNCKVNVLATIIQSAGRMHIAVRRYNIARVRIVLIQSALRMGAARVRYRRAMRAKKAVHAKEAIAAWCQRHHRGNAGRARFALALREREEREREEAERAQRENSVRALRVKMASVRAEQEQRAKARARTKREGSRRRERAAAAAGMAAVGAGATALAVATPNEESKMECEPIAGAIGSPSRNDGFETEDVSSVDPDDNLQVIMNPAMGRWMEGPPADPRGAASLSHCSSLTEEDQLSVDNEGGAYADIDLEAGRFGPGMGDKFDNPDAPVPYNMGKNECFCMIFFFVVGSTLLTVGIVFAIKRNS